MTAMGLSGSSAAYSDVDCPEMGDWTLGWTQTAGAPDGK